MAFELKQTEGCFVIAISGELDHHSAAEIRINADSEIEQRLPQLVLFDMSGISFMDSSGIGLILGRQRLCESYGGAVAIKNPSASAYKIISLAGLSHLIIGREKSPRVRTAEKNGNERKRI